MLDVLNATLGGARVGLRDRRSGPDNRGAAGLRADCARCVGLCCIAPAFAASADFAIDKGQGQPCPNLGADGRCGIHDRLRDLGFPGCTVYDCFGAGQQVVQVTFGGQDPLRTPASAARLFAAFTVLRQLHELLWYLTEAVTLAQTHPPRGDGRGDRGGDGCGDRGGDLLGALRAALAQTERYTRASAQDLAVLDLTTHRDGVNDLLLRISKQVRLAVRRTSVDRRGANLMGADLRGADLYCAALRGVCLIRADLRGADLRGADLTGVDFRGADLRGADLTGSLFLTQSQLDAAQGDLETKLSPSLTRPCHWVPAPASR